MADWHVALSFGFSLILSLILRAFRFFGFVLAGKERFLFFNVFLLFSVFMDISNRHSPYSEARSRGGAAPAQKEFAEFHSDQKRAIISNQLRSVQ